MKTKAACPTKQNLFLEAAKLAEMEGLDSRKADFKGRRRNGKQAVRISEKRRAQRIIDGGLEIIRGRCHRRRSEPLS